MASIFRSSKFGLRTNSIFDYDASGKQKTRHSSDINTPKIPDIPNIPKLNATGGTILTPGNGYKYHIFTSPGTFTVSSSGKNIQYIVVGGGGGGGNGFYPFYDACGGGGGAGGYLTGSFYGYPNIGDYAITIGSGGGAGSPGSSSTIVSLYETITANGGGKGGLYAGPGAFPASIGSGGPGGSGGGAWYGSFPSESGGSSVSGQGNPGGNSPAGFAAGGGGGAGAVGGPGGAGVAGIGGIGVRAFSGDSGIPSSYGLPGPSPGRWFAGGGGGGSASATSPVSNPEGGIGGGGWGGLDPASGALNGSPFTGSGGGGGANPGGDPAPAAAGDGGPGIVIIRYIN